MDINCHDPYNFDDRRAKRPRYSERHSNGESLLNDDRSRDLSTNKKLFDDSNCSRNMCTFQNESRRFEHKLWSTNYGYSNVRHDHVQEREGAYSTRRSQNHRRFSRPEDDRKNTVHKRGFSNVEENDYPAFKRKYSSATVNEGSSHITKHHDKNLMLKGDKDGRRRAHKRKLSYVDKKECSSVSNSICNFREDEKNPISLSETILKNEPAVHQPRIQSCERKSNVKVRMMGKKYLEKLITKEPNEILLTLCSPENGFLQLLDQIGDRKDLIAIILIALGNACASDLRQNLIYLINAVVKKSMFMLCSVLQYLASFHRNNMENLKVQSFEKLIKFLGCYSQILPASACETLSVILPLLKISCQTIEPTHPDLFVLATQEIAKLELQKDSFLEKHSDANFGAAQEMEKIQMTQPPENFRTIPILPNNFDIWNDRPFLRPNIIDGKYTNIEHYLDVQFRLLREDYIRPLRNGIAKYLSFKKDKKSAKKCKDVKIYLNVHIIKQELQKGIPVHLVSFDVAEFGKVNWEFSKRFLSGSLVCLSDDDFQTSYFASVAYRDIAKLSDGILILKFNELSDDVLNFSPNQTFVMIETDAYFEAYRHNLSVLQEIELDKFPLGKYIVDVSKDIGNPAYLNKSSIYDIGPLFKPIELFNTKKTDRSEAFEIQVLNDEQWPKAEDVHLDESQYNALKVAITKEFTVIQGPPGTGKTYVGLKIVQLLLHNMSHWGKGKTILPPQKTRQSPDRYRPLSPLMAPLPKELLDIEEAEIIDTPLDSRPKKAYPILVVCYTNHALDQFLEGVLSFTHHIIRVGGRCSSDKLSKYQLDVLRKSLQQKRDVPRHIFSNLRQKNFELKVLGEELRKLQKELEVCTKRLLTTEMLKKYMYPFQHSLLKDHQNKMSNSRLHYWLNLEKPTLLIEEEEEHNEPPPIYKNANKKEGYNNPFNTNKNNIQYPIIENEEYHMADVEYMEDMRGISKDEFADMPMNQDWKTFNNGNHGTDKRDKWRQELKREYEERIMRKLENSVPMSEHDPNMVGDVWKLNPGNRWCLYKYWLNLYIEERQDNVHIVQQKIRIGYQEVMEMRMEESLNVLRGAKVVGMTTTGAAKYRKIVQHLKPKIVIIEEAAEIMEAHTISAISSETQHIILIGDHKQLRPNPNVYDLAVKFHLDVSLFERMVKNGISFQQLTIQHRMHPSIASLLVPHIYQNLENHPSVFKYESIRGVSKNLFFVTHHSAENNENDSRSKVNDYEANFIAGLCRYFILQGYSSSQITVLTTYSGQLFLLKSLIKKNPLLQQVRITVVDNFQGEENDIILLSFVRSNEEGKIGFLSIMNRVCVALSRAKKGLFAIGNFTLLAEKNKLWKSILSSLKQQDAIGSELSLMCRNHPDVVTQVSNGRDFDKVPEGGCMKPCEYRLNCGHTCTRMCHTYDPKHDDINCKKKCDKKCENNHPCRKLCYEACDLCEIRVKKEMPKCKHEVLLPCHVLPTFGCCTARCEKKLPCGHSCERQCGETCTSTCRKLITVKLSCGHDREMRCYKAKDKDDDLVLCKSKCGAELQCGHICSGTCGSCHQGRLHQRCQEECKRILVCGHECEAKCAVNCPPCRKRCENKCKHSKCARTCGFPCVPCKERCSWSCKHKKCNKKCGELCDREPCNIPCTKILKCLHKCIGLCGEPCPKMCAICNPEVKEIFFGDEDLKHARFIELEDCKHVFELGGITHWMEMAEERDGEIQMKACPKCKTMIRKSLRFGNTVKTCLTNIEKVKSVIYGEICANKKKRCELKERLHRTMETTGKYEKFLLPLFNEFINRRHIDNTSIVRSENVVTMMKDYVKISERMYYLRSGGRLFQRSDTFRQIERFTLQTFEFIENFLSKEYWTASNQQLEELSAEIHRLEQIEIFMGFLSDSSNALQEDKEGLFKQIADCLCKLGPFGPPDKKQFDDAFVKVNDSAVINVSNAEKKSILKAMQLTRGHWYMCPNGHVYCITECGGAMVESKCNECGAAIGGRSHALRGDNRVATAMDGSQHPAWSEAYNNMGNYLELN